MLVTKRVTLTKLRPNMTKQGLHNIHGSSADLVTHVSILMMDDRKKTKPDIKVYNRHKHSYKCIKLLHIYINLCTKYVYPSEHREVNDILLA